MYHFTLEKNGKKCKIKDLTVLSIEMKRGKINKKERQEEGEYQHRNHQALHVHLPVPWCFFATMHHDDGWGAQTHDVL